MSCVPSITVLFFSTKSDFHTGWLIWVHYCDASRANSFQKHVRVHILCMNRSYRKIDPFSFLIFFSPITRKYELLYEKFHLPDWSFFFINKNWIGIRETLWNIHHSINILPFFMMSNRFYPFHCVHHIWVLHSIYIVRISMFGCFDRDGSLANKPTTK